MLPNTKRVKREESSYSQEYGLQSLTPIYGQVIQSAPSWSGPFEAPPLPNTVVMPKANSPNSNSAYYSKLIDQLSQQSLMALPLLFL